jgi:hypothetical protein
MIQALRKSRLQKPLVDPEINKTERMFDESLNSGIAANKGALSCGENVGHPIDLGDLEDRWQNRASCVTNNPLQFELPPTITRRFSVPN